MITACDENFIKNIIGFESTSFRCRIVSLCNSYQPPLPFTDYWLFKTDGVCTGAAARNGADYVLLLTDDTNLGEVSIFLRMGGARRVLCDAQYKLELPGYSQTDGYVLKRAEPYTAVGDVHFCVPMLKDVYKLLKKCESVNFRVPAFEDFYIDMSHRLRHKTARIFGVSHKGRLASVGMTTAECEDSAILGAVCCLPELRRRGFASDVVKHLANWLISEGKTVYLHRAKDENREFYNSLGFEPCGMWREYFFN